MGVGVADAAAVDFGVGVGVGDDFGLAELLLVGVGLDTAEEDADGEPDALADAVGAAVFSGLTVVADGTSRKAIALTATSPTVLPDESG